MPSSLFLLQHQPCLTAYDRSSSHLGKVEALLGLLTDMFPPSKGLLQTTLDCMELKKLLPETKGPGGGNLLPPPVATEQLANPRASDSGAQGTR